MPDIHKGPDRRSHPVPLSFLYFVGGKVIVMENQNGRNLRGAAKAVWNRHVQFRRHDIGKIVNAECRLMRVNALSLVIPVSRPKGPKD